MQYVKLRDYFQVLDLDLEIFKTLCNVMKWLNEVSYLTSPMKVSAKIYDFF